MMSDDLDMMKRMMSPSNNTLTVLVVTFNLVLHSNIVNWVFFTFVKYFSSQFESSRHCQFKNKGIVYDT